MLFTPEEIAVLEKDPTTAPLAKKLKEGVFIPKERFDEVNNAKKVAEDALRAINDAKAAEEAEIAKKKGDFEKLTAEQAKKQKELEDSLKSEKAVADQFRTFVADKKKAIKEALGEAYLPEYDSDSFSLASLEKVAEFQGKAVGTVTKPAKQSTDKKIFEQSPEEFKKTQADALAGKLLEKKYD